MKRRILLALMLSAALFLCSGCGLMGSLLEKVIPGRDGSSESSSTVVSGSSSDLQQEAEPLDEEEEDARIFPEDGFAGGRIEDVMATAFFDFTLVSAERCDEYNGYTPAEGTQLVDVVIRVYNTFGETLPMFSSDFQIQWGEADDAFGYPVEEITGDDVAPEEYSLHPFETVEYHHVYQVPADSQEYAVAYLEMFDDESTGDMFFVYFELPLEE